MKMLFIKTVNPTNTAIAFCANHFSHPMSLHNLSMDTNQEFGFHASKQYMKQFSSPFTVSALFELLQIR